MSWQFIDPAREVSDALGRSAIDGSEGARIDFDRRRGS
jgi:hypothetical protein